LRIHVCVIHVCLLVPDVPAAVRLVQRRRRVHALRAPARGYRHGIPVAHPRLVGPQRVHGRRALDDPLQLIRHELLPARIRPARLEAPLDEGLERGRPVLLTPALTPGVSSAGGGLRVAPRRTRGSHAGASHGLRRPGSEPRDGRVLLEGDVRRGQRRDRRAGRPGVPSSRSWRGGVPGLRRHRLRPALRGVVASPRLLVGVIGLPRGGVLGGSGRGLTGLVGPGCGRGGSTARGLLLRVLLRGGLAGVIGLPGRGRVTPARAARWLHHADLCARLPDQEALGSSRWSSRAPPPAPHASKRRAGLPCRVDRCAEARGDVSPRVGGGFG
jgi:hypothetical protein